MTATTKGPIMADDTAALVARLRNGDAMDGRTVCCKLDQCNCATMEEAADTITAQAAEIAERQADAAAAWDKCEERRIAQEKAEAALAAAEARVAVAFNHGYVIACCNLQNLHGSADEACDVLAELGVKQHEIEAMDLSEYDATALAEIRVARKDDPVGVKDGAA
jgi:hypothetical protein